MAVAFKNNNQGYVLTKAFKPDLKAELVLYIVSYEVNKFLFPGTVHTAYSS